MRIFFVSLRLPFPPDRGDRIATFNQIRHLSRSHEVHVFCLAHDRGDTDGIAGLLEHAASVTAIPTSPLAGKIRAGTALLTGRSLSVAIPDEAGLHAAIREKAAVLKPDLIIVYSSNVAQFAEHFPDTPRIMQFADLDSLKFEQYAKASPPPMNWLYAREYRKLLEYERHIAAGFDHSLVCTEIERRDFERLIPGRPVTCVGNGVDLEYFRTAGAEKTPGRMIFTGIMDYLPNIDAVTWFCDEILPLVQARIPGASFVICGARPNATVLKLAGRPGVTVTGRVPDVRPHLDQSEVAVLPIRISRGIQNKLLEAMAMNLPCVSTRPVWQSTTIPEGSGILVGDMPAAFADRLIGLLGDRAMRDRMAVLARREMETRYTWDAQMGLLDQVVAAVTGHAEPRLAERESVTVK